MGRIILNLIRSETGNQCRSNKIGVVWSNLRELVISRAAAFCTDLSFLITLFGTLYFRILPASPSSGYPRIEWIARVDVFSPVF